MILKYPASSLASSSMKAHNQAWTIISSWHQCGISKPKSSHSTNSTCKTKVKAFTPHSSQRLILELVGNLSLSFHYISSELYKDFWSTVTSPNSTLKKNISAKGLLYLFWKWICIFVSTYNLVHCVDFLEIYKKCILIQYNIKKRMASTFLKADKYISF